MSVGRSEEYARALSEAERYSDQADRTSLRPAPLTGLAIITCMDARLMPAEIFGLRAGDANVIRNAGALASDDAIRSLVLSQRLLGSREVIVLGHTGCGLDGLGEEEFRTNLAQATGQRLDLRFGAFHDLDEHVRAQVERIRHHPLLLPVPVHGLVYEVETGRLREVA